MKLDEIISLADAESERMNVPRQFRMAFRCGFVTKAANRVVDDNEGKYHNMGRMSAALGRVKLDRK